MDGCSLSGALDLDRRAGDAAIGAEDTAIARLGMQNGPAVWAGIDDLAIVFRHARGVRAAACRATDRAIEFDWR